MIPLLRRIHLHLCFLLVLSAAGGCGQKRDNKPENIAPAPAVVNFGPAPTDEECREFGKQLEAAVAAIDRLKIDQLVRWQDLTERCLSGLDVQKAVLEGAKKAAGQTRYSDQIVRAVQSGAKFKFLGTRPIDGRTRVFVRVIPPDGGLSYQQFILARYPDGQIGAEDIFVMATGEMFSQTLRRILLKGAAELDQGLLARLGGAEQHYVKNMSKIQSMMPAIREGRQKEAFATYSQLPPELQKDKIILIVGIMAAQHDDREYVRLMGTFRELYPNDPAIDLLSIDFHLLRKEYHAALDCIEKLDNVVGGDPFLKVVRGNLKAEEGKFAEAKHHHEVALKEEPTLEAAHWGLITIALREKSHDDALLWLKRTVERFPVIITEQDLRSNMEYAAFVQSPQFQDFIKWSKAR